MPLDTSRPAIIHIGNYEILLRIAEGGMGTVYKARHQQSGDIVAIKVLSTTVRNPVILQRFKREFDAARMVDHPNVVKAIEYGEENSNPYLVMEFVDGESLGQRIERDGKLPESTALEIISQVCQGLRRAHKAGLVHRDVKPDNILITREGQAKLTDLGLVKDADNELNLTKTGRGLGTPHFMAPEQFRNAKNADIRCDIYSLGATLYSMLTGEIPFDKCSPLDCWMKKVHNDFVPPRQLNPEMSERVDWAIRRSMSAEPDKRPVSCREFVEDLYGRSTRPPLPGAEFTTSGEDLWYLIYEDEQGQTQTVKGNTEAIRRAIREGYLGNAAAVRACRSKHGPFQKLHGFPEFRDLIVQPAPLRPTLPNPQTSTPLQHTHLPAEALLEASSGLADDTDGDAVELGRMPSERGSTAGRSLAGRSGSRSRLSKSGPTSSPTTTRLPSSKPSYPHYPHDESNSPTGRLPHIQMPDPGSDDASSDWIMWLVVLMIALGSALVGFMFFGG